MRVQIPLERSFTEAEFLRLQKGIEPKTMEQRWHTFFRGPWLTFVRSGTGFCIYKARLEKNDGQFKIAEVWASRDPEQYGYQDTREDVERLTLVINEVILADLHL